MDKIKVVIATHNGHEFLKQLLPSIQRYEVPNEDVTVVDNLSTDPIHKTYLRGIAEQGYNVLYNEESTYELGAYKWAVDHGVEGDVYFFFQDSIRITANIFEEIPPKLNDNNVYTFLSFECGANDHDPNDHKQMFEDYGTNQYSKGIFGNMFFIRDSVLKRVMPDWVMPRNKLGSTTSERGLGIVFDRHNVTILEMQKYNTNIPLGSGYHFFQKLHGHKWRQ